MSIKQFLNLELFERPSLKWLIVIEILSAILIITTILISSSSPLKIPPDPEFQKEMRKANEELRRAYEKQDLEKEKMMEFLEKKDSIYREEMQATKDEIKKQKKSSNEKINSINRYGSDDIRSAFSNLPNALN